MAAVDRLFATLPDDTLMRIELAYGRALARVANHRFGHAAVTVAHRVLARLTGTALKIPAIGGTEPPVAVAKRTMEKFFLPILEPRQADDRGYTFEFARCPYGLEAGSGELCHAVMNLEEEIMRTIGGELVIEARIAEGAPKCRFTVRNAPA